MDSMMVGQPVAAFGIGGPADSVGVSAIAPSSPSGAPAMRGQAFFPTGGRSFYRSAEFGLILGLVLVVYIDGRVLPRKR